MQVLWIIGLVYISIGFIYSIYVVMSRGGTIFSIPINTLLGPIYIPFVMVNEYRKLGKRKKPQEQQEPKSPEVPQNP